MSDHPSLIELNAAQPFVDRHIGLRPEDIDAMLETFGFDSLDALMAAAVPGGIRTTAELDLPAGRPRTPSPASCGSSLRRTTRREPMIGLGYHGTITPPVIRRNVLEDPSWYTAYTPYQPEISQGRLEALLNFQTVVGDLTGLPTANAALLDEGTAAAEAMTLVRRANRKATGPFVVDATRCRRPSRSSAPGPRRWASRWSWPTSPTGCPTASSAACCCSTPAPPAGSSTRARWPRTRTPAARSLVVAADLLALTLLESPGELGADVVVGSTQRFGVPLFYGGPHAGYMAVAAGLERHLPGRLVGVSVDAEGRPAYRLALQTREQHIRRDKATSNICTAQVLLAVVASMYAVYHGPEGLRAIARRTHRLRRRARRGAARGRRRGGARRVLRHRAGPGPGPGCGGRRRGPRGRACTCGWSTPTTVGLSCSERTGRHASRRCWRRSA